MDYPLSCIL